MKHYIIVKFSDTVADKAALIRKVEELFSSAEPIEGVHGFSVVPNCVDRPNRYDLMIKVDMDGAALQNWDASALHKAWKERFGGFVAAKTIFDEE